MADPTDTAGVIIRPPIAWGIAVLTGLTLNWLLPLPLFKPSHSGSVLPETPGEGSTGYS